MPTPRKSKRFGGDAAHQRLMMANLAASLFAAEAIVTTEAKAKALRPVAEQLITKAKKAQDEGSAVRVHQLRQIQGFLGDREMTHKLINEVAPALPRPQRRLHAHPQARHPPRRPRRHGAHRARLAHPHLGGLRTIRRSGRRAAPTSAPLAAQIMNVKLVVAYDGARVPRVRRQRGRTHGRRSADRRDLDRRPRPVVLTGAGRTDAGVHAWGQVVSVDLPDGADLEDLTRRVNKLCAPGDRRPLRRGRSAPTSMPASRRSGGTTATTCGTRRTRTR